MIAIKRQLQYSFLFIYKHKVAFVFILFGILVRLLLMPSAVHDDMLSSTWREHLLVFQGNFKVSDLMELLMSGYMELIKPLLTDLPSLLNRASANVSTGTVSYSSFVNNRHALRDLFLLKVPYLLFDLASLILIWKILKERAEKFRGIMFWALNPIALFAVFMWGRFETLPIFFTLLAFFYANKKNAWLSLLALSLAVSSRTGYILFLPFFLIYFGKNWKNTIMLLLIGIIPPLLTSHILGLLGGGSLLNTLQDGFLDFTINGQISTGFTAIAINLVIFPLILYLFYSGQDKMNFKRLVNFSTIGLFSFFAFSYFHPQYLSWITPCVVLALALNKKIAWPFIGMTVAFFLMIDIYFGSARTTGLFLPLDPSLFTIIGGLQNQSLFVNWQTSSLITIFHSLFVLMLGVISFILYKDANKAK